MATGPSARVAAMGARKGSFPASPVTAVRGGWKMVRVRPENGVRTGQILEGPNCPGFDFCSSRRPGWAWPRTCLRRFDPVRSNANFLHVAEAEHGVVDSDVLDGRAFAAAVVFAVANQDVRRDRSLTPWSKVDGTKVAS